MEISEPATLDITGTLDGETLFITGATGFLGKVLVEKLLWSVPGVGKLLLLVRPRDDASGAERVRREILDAPLMARLRALHGEDWERWVANKVEVIAGDLGQERFGLEDEAYRALCRQVDRVVANAATVTFDERLDQALNLNAHGALRTLALARDAGHVPLLHVSTCFVSGQRTGEIVEELPRPEPRSGSAFNLESAIETLDAACERARQEGGEAMVEAGADYATRYGFNDIYTLTKALGELLLARDRGTVPAAILRPAIVESAAAEPMPGWIEDIRVADPLLVAYGKGRAVEFPGSADVPMELVPVDHVVNAMIAALAVLERGRDPETLPIYQVASSRHPITLGELLRFAREGFARTPLRDDAGAPIEVGEASFVEPTILRETLLESSLDASPESARLSEHFRHLIDIYGPYLRRGARYNDEATQALERRLSEGDQAVFPFDIAVINWRLYLEEGHIPGLIRFALKAETGAPPPREWPKIDGPQLSIAARSLDDLFARVAAETPSTMALQTFRDGRWLRYTYDQARNTIANIAHRLATTYGIGRGDRVALWSSGCPEWVLVTLAIHRLGAVVVPLDPQWPASEIPPALSLVEAKLLCAMPRLGPALDNLRGEISCPATVLAAPFVPEPDVGPLPGVDPLAEGTAEEGDLASILFTSGSTRAPKAVPLTHGNYLANVRDLTPLIRLERERMLSMLPIHHIFEQMIGIFVPITGGSTISFVAEIKPAEINWMMNTTRPTMLVAVPRILELLHGGIMQSVQAGGPKLQRLFRLLFFLSRITGARYGDRLFAKVHQRFGGCLRRIASGGSPLRASLGRSFELMGFQIAEGYGLTETSPVLTVNPWADLRFGSVGQTVASVDIELRQPADGGEGLEKGWGEVWARGPNVMSGYFENPEATAAVLVDGWFNTGDIGHFDKDGYLYLSGRTKDIIVTDAGKNVYPEEVEDRYRGLPGVEELVILGLPSDAGGERVTGLVVPKADADPEQIREAIGARSSEVPSYQQISQIEFWRGELPKTTTLKVKRAQLRDAVLAGNREGKAVAAPPPPDDVERSDGERFVLETLARLTRTRPDLLRDTDRLADLGVDSLTRVELVGAIETRFDVRLEDAVARDVGSIAELLALAPESDPGARS